MNKSLIVLIFILAALSPFVSSDSYAIDPVTIAILAPVAIKAAEVSAPYVMRGLQCGANHMLNTGARFLDIFRLPLGVLQTTIGIPFNQFSNGVNNIVLGAVAPITFTIDVLCMPLAFCGLVAN